MTYVTYPSIDLRSSWITNSGPKIPAVGLFGGGGGDILDLKKMMVIVDK